MSFLGMLTALAEAAGAGGGPYPFTETFTAADGTDLTALDAGWSQPIGAANTLEVLSNRAIYNGAAGFPALSLDAVVLRDFGQTDMVVRGTLVAPIDSYRSSVSLALACDAAGNNGLFVMKEDRRVRVWKRIAGTVTVVAAGLGATTNPAGVWTATWSAGALTISTATDGIIYGPTALADVAAAGGTYAGIGGYGDNSRDPFDDWSVAVS